jgi:hypothetical protein
MLVVMILVALAAAAGFGTVAWRVIQEDRARAAARVAALGSAIDAAPAGPHAVNGVRAMFAPGGGAGTNPLVKLAGGLVVVVLFIIGVALSGGRNEPAAAQPAAGLPNGQATAAGRPDASLELLSMRHERRDTTLTVTGLVRNPGTIPAEHIVAVVFAFDRDGSFVASGRAPLDFAVLASGDESPFRVAVPDVGDVGRYRVSFRTDAGVIRHVDRRGRSDAPATAGDPAVTPGNASTGRLQVSAR